MSLEQQQLEQRNLDQRLDQVCSDNQMSHQLLLAASDMLRIAMLSTAMPGPVTGKKPFELPVAMLTLWHHAGEALPPALPALSSNACYGGSWFLCLPSAASDRCCDPVTGQEGGAGGAHRGPDRDGGAAAAPGCRPANLAVGELSGGCNQHRLVMH